MCDWNEPLLRRASAFTNHRDPERCFVKTTKRAVGSGPRVVLIVHVLRAARGFWTSRDAADATAANAHAKRRRIVNLAIY